jgi:Spy/CpxP family protein refolding chaperone
VENLFEQEHTMNEQSVPCPEDSSAAKSVRGRRWAIAGLAAGITAAAGAFAMQAHAHGGPMGFGPPGGFHGGMDAMDPAALGKRIDAMVAFRLADIDATPEQRERIAGIVKAAAADLRTIREQHMKARRQSLALFAAPTIDRAALEKLRIEQVQLGDSASRRMLQAMMDSADALNADQRAKLIERWQRRMPQK